MVKGIYDMNTKLRKNAKNEFEENFLRINLFLEKLWEMLEIIEISN